MAEANVGPPESAADESGSGEEQKEEKQGDDEGDRAFEVILNCNWVVSNMNPIFSCFINLDIPAVQHMPGHCKRCCRVHVWTPFLLALLAPGAEHFDICAVS